jgi:hypothetical protein
MTTIYSIAMAAGVLLSLVLHYVGRKNATAEKLAEGVDKVEDLAKTVSPKV